MVEEERQTFLRLLERFFDVFALRNVQGCAINMERLAIWSDAGPGPRTELLNAAVLRDDAKFIFGCLLGGEGLEGLCHLR